LDHIEPVKQVLTKFVLLDRIDDVTVRGGNQPDIHPQFLRSANPRKRTILQKSQQLACNGRLMSAISSRKIPPIGSCNPAAFCFNAR